MVYSKSNFLSQWDDCNLISNLKDNPYFFHSTYLSRTGYVTQQECSKLSFKEKKYVFLMVVYVYNIL